MMVRVVVNEFIYDLRNLFRRWRIIVFVVFIVMWVAGTIEASDDEFHVHIMLLYFCMWSFALLKPRVNKLHYLLPGDATSRVPYIIYKTICVLLFDLIVYIFVQTISAFISDNNLLNSVERIFHNDLPYIIIFASYAMTNSYNMESSQVKNLKNSNKRWYYLSSTLMIVSMLYAFFYVPLLDKWLPEVLYIPFTILAYISIIPILCFNIFLLKKIDTRYENIRKVEKFFN